MLGSRDIENTSTEVLRGALNDPNTTRTYPFMAIYTIVAIFMATYPFMVITVASIICVIIVLNVRNAE